MGRKKINVLPYNKMKKAIAAFRDGKKTLLSQLVINQVFLDRGITEYKGENSLQFAERLADKFLDLLDWDVKDKPEETIKTAIKGYYNIVTTIIALPN